MSNKYKRAAGLCFVLAVIVFLWDYTSVDRDLRILEYVACALFVASAACMAMAVTTFDE